MEIPILYQDAALLLCQKPAGLAVEGGTSSLLPLLAAQVGGAVYPVHRLDQPVGGLLLVARTRPAAAALGQAVADGRLQKRYLAVAAGALQPACGQLQDLLYHDPRANKTFVVRRPRRGVRPAALRYRTLAAAPAPGVSALAPPQQSGAGPAVLANVEAGRPAVAPSPAATSGATAPAPLAEGAADNGLCLLEIELLTGRTHQIRAQLASRAHPLAGDGRYGSRHKGPLALWSAELAFCHPDTGAPLHFVAVPPAEHFWQPFAAALAAWRRERG